MTLQISGEAVDVGMVARHPDAMLHFYRELLGLEEESVINMPAGGSMHRLRAGNSLIKILIFDPLPDDAANPGGISAATGLRYFSIHVSNLQQATAEIEAAGHKVLLACKAFRAGVVISIVKDPDGNNLELVEYS